MAFREWESLDGLVALHEHIGQLVGSDAPGWTPAVDLSETVDAFALVVELPGLSRDAIDIQVEERRITIRGERIAHATPSDDFLRVERGHGRFQRAFTFPEPIAVERVTGQLADGVLSVTLPKRREGARSIEVS